MGHTAKVEQGMFKLVMLVSLCNMTDLLERGNLPQAKSSQQAELHTLKIACQLSGQTVNIHTTNSRYAFLGSSIIWGC